MLLAAGALPRFLFLGHDSLWLDEALSAATATLPLHELLTALHADQHPPGYYLLLHAWTLLTTGGAAGLPGEIVLRSLSAMASLLTLPLLYRVGMLVAPAAGGRRLAGRITMGLAALSPFALALAREARPYALLGLLLALQWLLWLLLRAGRSGIGPWAGLCLALAAGFYVHYHAMFFAAALTLATLLARDVPPGFRRRWSICLGIAVVTFVPWLPVLAAQASAGVRDWIGFDSSPLILIRTLGAFFRSSAPRSEELFLWSLPVLALAFRAARRGGRETAWLLAATLAIPYAVSLRLNVYEARYVVGGALAAWALMGLAATTLRGSRARWRAVAVLPLVAMAVGLARGDFRGPGRHEDWRALARQVRAAASPGDVVLFPFRSPMAPYAYYAADATQSLVGALEQVGDRLVLRDDLEEMLSGATGVWLITYLEPVYDPDGRIRKYLAGAGFEPLPPIVIAGPRLQAIRFHAADGVLGGGPAADLPG